MNPPWSAHGAPEWVKEQHPGREIASFPGTDRFVKKAYEMSRQGITVATLLPQAFDAIWMKPFLKLADEVRVGRRFRFIDVHGRPGPQPPGGHTLLVFRPHVPSDGWPGGARPMWDWNPALHGVSEAMKNG